MWAGRILRATRALASWQTLATARSSGRAREARAPEVAQAARWSPSGSSRPRQALSRGASCSARRRRRRRSTRSSAQGMVTASRVLIRRTVKQQVACGAAWDSSSARDAGGRVAKCVSNVRCSQARAAASPGDSVLLVVVSCWRWMSRLWGIPSGDAAPLSSKAFGGLRRHVLHWDCARTSSEKV